MSKQIMSTFKKVNFILVTMPTYEHMHKSCKEGKTHYKYVQNAKMLSWNEITVTLHFQPYLMKKLQFLSCHEEQVHRLYDWRNLSKSFITGGAYVSQVLLGTLADIWIERPQNKTPPLLFSLTLHPAPPCPAFQTHACKWRRQQLLRGVSYVTSLSKRWTSVGKLG